MRLRKRIMKVASKEFSFDDLNDEQKRKVIYKIKDIIFPQLQKWAQSLLDSELENKGYSVEMDFDFKYEYYPEEDSELFEIDLPNCKIKKIEVTDGSTFWDKFNFEKIMDRLSDEYAMLDKEYPDDIDFYDLFGDIDCGFVFEEFTYSSSKSPYINYSVANNFKFNLINGSSYQDVGITPELNQFLIFKLGMQSENVMMEGIEDFSLDHQGYLYDYAPLRILKREFSDMKFKFKNDDPNEDMSSETISMFSNFKAN